MKTNVEVLESGATKLTVTIEAAEVDNRIKKTYRDFGKKYRFPGFRPGHVPRQVIDAQLGKEAVLASVTDDMLNETWPLAIDAADVYPISQPKFDDVEGLVEAGKDYVYSAEFDAKPEFELSSYEPVHVEVPFKTATEAEIDEQIEEIGKYYMDYVDAAANTKVKADSVVSIDLKGSDADGEEIESLAAEDRHYELGQGLFPAAFDEQLIGMKKGDQKTFEITVGEAPSMLTSVLQGKTDKVTFDVTLKAVKKGVVPEFTDEFAKEKLGFADMADLRARMGEQISAQKESVIPRILENNALFELQQRLQGEVPEAMAEDAERELLQSFFEQLQRQGGTLDAYLASQGITADKFRDDVKAQASDNVAQNLALDAWARHAGITVSDEEVEEEFKTSGAKDWKSVYADWKKNGRLHVVREGILRGKTLEAILKDADVEEVETPNASEKKAPAKKSSAKKSTAKKAAAAEEPAAEEAAAPALTSTELNKLKVAELREKAEGMGLETKGLKKAELVQAILDAQA